MKVWNKVNQDKKKYVSSIKKAYVLVILFIAR